MLTAVAVFGSLLVLGTVVFFHELGHFLAAKISNVAVGRFSVGFGKALWSREFGGTLYQVAVLPCGGFVEIIGQSDNGEQVEEQLARLQGKLSPASVERLRDRSRWFHNRPGWAQLLVAAGGPLFSFLFTILVFTMLTWTLGSSAPVGRPEIISVLPGTPAAKAGLQPGDAFVSINGKAMEHYGQVIETIGMSGGSGVALEMLRGGDTVRISISPESNPISGGEAGMPFRIGVALKPQEFFAKEVGFFPALRHSVGMVGESIHRTASLVVQLITGKMPLSSISGPVGITKSGSDWIKAGLLPTLIFAAMISSALGAAQLIPIPPLDGSRILFAGWKMLTGRPVNRKFEGALTGVGTVALLGLMLVISAREIFWLFV